MSLNGFENMVFMPNWKKYSFDCNHVEFLGYVISSEGISMDLAKVKTVVEWQTPGSLRDV